MKSKTLIIDKMSCAACARAAEKEVNKLEGISEASVNFATSKMNLIYDEEKVNIENVKEAIKKAGFEAREEMIIKEVVIPIGGMT